MSSIANRSSIVFSIVARARSRPAKLLITTLALAVCRVVSLWDSLLAGSAAIVILVGLAVSSVAGMPRVRRVLLFFALPVITLANGLTLSLGAFVTLLGMQGLLAQGLIGPQGPPWDLAFTLVPLAAAANLAWLTRPTTRLHRLGCAANLALAGYVFWYWRPGGGASPMWDFPPPVDAIVLIGLAIASLATLACDARVAPSARPVRPRFGRRRLVPASAVLFCVAVAVVWFPVYRRRQLARSLETFGMWANFGVPSPGLTLPIEIPWELYDYLGEVNGVYAPEALKGDADRAGRLLNSLPWLDTISMNDLPVGAERLLRPLAGNTGLRQIALKGPGVTDETLADVGRLPSLYRAVFERARITDAGLANLAGATWLQNLVIRQTPITGDGLVHLASLPRLTALDLSGTDFGDEQAAILPQLATLRSLSLNNTRLTDQGLPSLVQCKMLSVLDISDTHISDCGVDRLRRVLPGCTILWHPTDEDR
ncbi:MAG TPA: hypothetical protein VHC22_23255 [Pirellulales bacterium]|nr:hypothetical protein [Pirellulales bacterium]